MAKEIPIITVELNSDEFFPIIEVLHPDKNIPQDYLSEIPVSVLQDLYTALSEMNRLQRTLSSMWGGATVCDKFEEQVNIIAELLTANNYPVPTTTERPDKQKARDNL